MRVWMCLFMLWCLALRPALAQDRDYGRSMGVTGRGIVATSQVPASQAGAHILERGGSAIYYAEHGYSVPEIIPDFWGIGRPKLKQTEEAQRVFLPHGKPPAVGEPFSNPDLGKILRLLADDQGAREFYEGETAQRLASEMAKHGGLITLDGRANAFPHLQAMHRHVLPGFEAEANLALFDGEHGDFDASL